MENKKLLKILRKDMSELEELIADVRTQKSYNEPEMEFIHTRAKGVKQLIHLINLNDVEEDQVTPIPLKEERFEQIKETVAEIQESVSESNPETKVEVAEDKPETKIEVAENTQIKEVVPEEKEVEQEKETETEVTQEAAPENDSKEENTDNEDYMLPEEVEKTQINGRLGDSFLKGKSVNDMVSDQNKLEFKLSNRPVSSIKTSIGINDRFQYIRELFDGSAEKFAETVTTIDSMNDIKEAVEYLRQNFKWRKTETSLKFVQLVKRRFSE